MLHGTRRALPTVLIALAAGAWTTEVWSQAALKTEKEKTSYSVGAKMGDFIVEGKELIDLDLVFRAIRDRFEGREMAVESAEIDRAFVAFQQQVRNRATTAARAEGEAYLAKMAKQDGVVTLPSGLMYRVLKEGTGRIPTRADTVNTHYRGTFIDGKEFDSSYSRGKPTSFPVTRVIAGWTEALLLMKEGEKRQLFIPSNLAYGERGSPPAIPPHSALVFEIELLNIVE